MAQIIQIFLLEFLQNLPLTLAFTFGFRQWALHEPGLPITIALGSTAGALLIRYTEPLIEPGRPEKTMVTIANIGVFMVAILLFIIYFSWDSGSWLVDIALGIAVGAAIRLVQARAARGKFYDRHLLAMAGSVPIGLLAIRSILLAIPPLPGGLVLCTIVTLLIVIFDYI